MLTRLCVLRFPLAGEIKPLLEAMENDKVSGAGKSATRGMQPMITGMGNVLVLDTCGDRAYIALAEAAPGSAAVAERRLGSRATQEELLPAIEEALFEAGTSLEALDAVAVVCGPGSFTGVRIGVAAAKGLCEAAGLKLVLLSRLAVLANAVPGDVAWAWLQAGRGDVYAERFARETSTKWDAVTGSLGKVRSADSARAEAKQECVAVCEESLRVAVPHATFVGQQEFEASLRRSAIGAVQRGCWADVALSDALYLRVPDAELALRARLG